MNWEMNMRRLLIGIAMLCVASLASADRIGYSRVFDCKAENNVLSAEHHHDWSLATRDARSKMISTTQDVFTSDNSYAHLTVMDKKSGVELFRTPTPALTSLWISGDSRFIVGISNIRLWNPIQVVVFSSKGQLLLAKAVDSRSFAGVHMTISNWVFWYKEPRPEISIESRGDSHYTLHVEGNDGTDRAFEFQEAR
jgi:hypothetical protein